jgi:hypothetical protein
MAAWCRITCCDARLPFSPTTAVLPVVLRRIRRFTSSAVEKLHWVMQEEKRSGDVSPDRDAQFPDTRDTRAAVRGSDAIPAFTGDPDLQNGRYLLSSQCSRQKSSTGRSEGELWRDQTDRASARLTP